MSAHCDCENPESYIRTETIRHGPENPVVARDKICKDCGGLISVLSPVSKEDFERGKHT